MIRAFLGRVFRTIRGGITAFTTPIIGETPLSKCLTVAWTIVGIGIWMTIWTKENGHDLLFSGVFVTLCFSLFLLALKPFFPVVEDGLVRLGFSYGFIGAAIYTTIIAGDWKAVDKISFVCFGTFHAHHWAKYTAVFVYFILVFFQNSPRQRSHWVTLGYTTSLILWLIALLSKLNFEAFPGNRSLQLEFAILGLFFFFTAMLISAQNEMSSRWYRIGMALSFGVVCGILLNGYIGMARDVFLSKDKVPSSLIFFNDVANCPLP